MTIHSACEIMINLGFTHRKRLIYFYFLFFYDATYLIPTRVQGVVMTSRFVVDALRCILFFPFFLET